MTKPPEDRDRIILAMLRPLGIEKGKPFTPDARQRTILQQASIVGELMARANGYAKRVPGSTVWQGKNWEYALMLKETNQETPTHTQLDERGSWFYEAVGVTVGMMGRTVGAGQVYLEASKDAEGNWLDGGKTYTLRVPKDAPVAQFWSFTVYDNETRCFVDTGSSPDRSSRDDIVVNVDGSTDLYFGPEPPGQAAGELDQDNLRQGLVHVFPAVRADAGLFRQDLAAAGYRTGAMRARTRPSS